MDTDRQVELPLVEPPKRHNETPLFLIDASHPNVTWLIELLRKNGWMTRREIIMAANKVVNDESIRWVRALVSVAGTQIVKAQSGFNCLENCTIDEIRHAGNQSVAQGKKMLDYGLGLLKAAHGRIG